MTECFYSLIQSFTHSKLTPGKDDVNVTSQETCLFLLTMLPRNEASSGLDMSGFLTVISGVIRPFFPFLPSFRLHFKILKRALTRPVFRLEADLTDDINKFPFPDLSAVE